jgi:flagella basal body P-ring formation protein FlgA
MIAAMIAAATIRTAALALLVAALPAATQAETLRPALKRSAVITGDLVRIGDLIENAGIVADIPIFRAPNLGDSGTVPAAAVAQAVRPHAILGLDTRGIAEVTVTRPSRLITGKDIQAELARLIAEQYGLGDPADLAVTVEHELRSLNVEPSAHARPRALRLAYDAHSGRFDALIEFPGARPLRFSGNAAVTAPALVMTRSLARGEIVGRADVAIERRPRTQVGRDVLTLADAAIGRAARQPLRAGQPLRGSDVMKPELVQRDAAVTLVYRSPGITLTVRGKASEGGAEGDLISATNLQSKRVIQGVVAADGSVVVHAATPRIVANLDPAPVRDPQ